MFNILKLHLFTLLGCMLVSIYVSASEEIGNRNNHAELEKFSVIAVKVLGRLDCSIYEKYDRNSAESACNSGYFLKEIDKYNLKIKSEDFLVLDSIAGPKKLGDIVSVLKDDLYVESIKVGEVVLISFNQRDDHVTYSLCDVYDIEAVREAWSKGVSKKDTLRARIPSKYCFAEPPSFDIDTPQKSTSREK